ncbi:MAG: HisA/HisF-related TIM barrel protein [Holophaga sp.]|nr:HisA/HisF-related TIM barrel protein [Holophaga sp.]
MKLLPTLNLQNGLAIPMFGGDQGPKPPGPLLDFLFDQGCNRLVLVDVDAAEGQGHNRELIASIMRRFHKGNTKVCIQVGGGIRSSDQAQFFLDHGATWITVGTVIQRSPLVVDQLLARFRDHLTAGVDARGGEIQSSGWREAAPLTAEAAAQRIREHGFKRILFIDIPPSAKAKPDFLTARTLAQSSRIPLFMGGSIRSTAHLKLAMEIPGMQGVAVDALQLLDDSDLLGSLNLAHS